MQRRQSVLDRSINVQAHCFPGRSEYSFPTTDIYFTILKKDPNAYWLRVPANDELSCRAAGRLTNPIKQEGQVECSSPYAVSSNDMLYGYLDDYSLISCEMEHWT